MPELIVVDRLCIGAGQVLMGALCIDTRGGGGSRFAAGITGTVNKASRAGTTPLLMTAFSVGKREHSQDTMQAVTWPEANYQVKGANISYE